MRMQERSPPLYLFSRDGSPSLGKMLQRCGTLLIYYLGRGLRSRRIHLALTAITVPSPQVRVPMGTFCGL
jgi:hypothetical protein